MKFQVIIVGVVLFGIGVLALLSGKRSEISVSELLGLGRSVYDDLEAVFKRPYVVVFKILSYSGMGTVLFGVALMIVQNLR